MTGAANLQGGTRETTPAGETEAARTLRRVSPCMREVRQGIAAALPAFQRASDAIRRLDAALYRAALDAYRREEGDPPGSERTSRLRKKRRDAVLRWFRRRYAGPDA